MNIFVKMIIIPLIICFLNSKFICSMNWTSENKISELDEKENIESTQCPKEFQDFCHKKSPSLENLLRILFIKKFESIKQLSKNKRVSGPSPLYDSLNEPCQCGMTFRQMDLGSSVFPRFFHTGVCKKNTCGLFHRCQPRKYKVRILKRKEAEDMELNTEVDEIHSTAFPESLQEDWVPDYVNIVVGCECLPKKI